MDEVKGTVLVICCFFIVGILGMLGKQYIEKLPDYSRDPMQIHENYKKCKAAKGTPEGCNKQFCNGLCGGGDANP
jgi:hypothetical protein